MQAQAEITSTIPEIPGIYGYDQIASRFTGYFRDAETGNDYAKNRYHQPGMGRFLTPDPYMALSGGKQNPNNPGSWNKYAYVLGDPINGTDRRGLYVDDDGGDGTDDGGEGSCDPTDPDGGCYDPASIPGNSCYGNYYVATGQESGASCQDEDDSTEDPAPTPCSNWGCMPAALNAAIAALQNKNSPCAQLFGTATTRAGAFNPVAVIQQIYNQGGGTVAGQSVGAHFSPWLPWDAITLGRSVIINGSSGSYWNVLGGEGNTTALAVLLLHEMGHVYNSLSGSGGSQIKYDGGFGSSTSDANSALIYKDCFGTP